MKLAERRNAIFLSPNISIFLLVIISLAPYSTLSIRFPDQISEISKEPSNQPLKTAIFAIGSFWRSEAVFGCLDGVVRTTAGYAGGSKVNPEYRSLGDHAESVQVVEIEAQKPGCFSNSNSMESRLLKLKPNLMSDACDTNELVNEAVDREIGIEKEEGFDDC